MAMSKKDYIAISQAFARGFAVDKRYREQAGLSGSSVAMSHTLRHVMEYMDETNPRFDKGMFANACHLPVELTKADELYLACVNLTKETDND